MSVVYYRLLIKWPYDSGYLNKQLSEQWVSWRWSWKWVVCDRLNLVYGWDIKVKAFFGSSFKSALRKTRNKQEMIRWKNMRKRRNEKWEKWKIREAKKRNYCRGNEIKKDGTVKETKEKWFVVKEKYKGRCQNRERLWDAIWKELKIDYRGVDTMKIIGE